MSKDRRSVIQNNVVLEVLDSVMLGFNKSLHEKGDKILVSTHEILGVLHEEFNELSEAVRLGQRSHVRVNEELIDIAVAAILGIVSIRQGLDW